MGYYWIGLLLLHCFHSSISALPTDRETKHQDVGNDIDDPEVGIVAHEIATRNQDPTENLVCRFVKKEVSATLLFPDGSKYVLPPVSVGLREYQYSPAIYTALCVSPEKPRPSPYLFAPPPPVASPTGPDHQVSKAPAATAAVVGSRPSSTALSAPPPAISLVFSSPIGSIGIGSVSSPAVNIETQSITDSSNHPVWLIKQIVEPLR